MANLYEIFEIVGTIAFSISGATTAIKREMDLFGVIVLSIITAVGGGALRDLIGNQVPSIFFRSNMILLAFVTAAVTFLIAYISLDVMEGKYFNLLFMISDSLGLAVFTIFGCQKMLTSYSYSPGIVVFFGVLTGVGGGLLRDILAGQKPYVLTKHFYASSCIVGALIYVVVRPYADGPAVLAGVASIFVLRILAAKFKWNLPKINQVH